MQHIPEVDLSQKINKSLKALRVFPVLGFELNERNTVKLDLSVSNSKLEAVDLTNTSSFSDFIQQIQHPYLIGIGGYAEDRFVYKRSSMFETKGKPRSLHLGVDLWGQVRTPVYCPIRGSVHSFAFNDRFGDYGATIILKHQVGDMVFHSLYGHLSLDSIKGLELGQVFEAGDLLCWFGEDHENGHWPPHLHFQLIVDMGGQMGDYPGVAPMDESEYYLSNCPDPNLILRSAVLG